jgi:long-chain acyl-CoA synthetase
MVLRGPDLSARADVTDLLAVGLAADPDREALVSRDDQMTWRELEDASNRLAGGYRNLGLNAGDRVASLMPNRISLVVHYLACFKAGLVATPLNYRYATPEIDHALEVSGATALVAHVERKADIAVTRLGSMLPLGVITFGDPERAVWPTNASLESLIANGDAAMDLGTPAPDAPAAIFFTSGSTGPAKGVTHSMETLGWMTASAAHAFALTPEDAFLPASSISHIGSFMWTLASFLVGAKVIHAQAFDAGEVLPLLRRYRPTVMAMIPAALTALVRDHGVTKEDFSSLRICRCGADKVSGELETEFSHLVGFLIARATA